MKKLPHVVAMIVICLLPALLPSRSYAQESIQIDVATYAPPVLFDLHRTAVTLTPAKPENQWESFHPELSGQFPQSLPALAPLLYAKQTVDATIFTAADLSSRLSNFLELRFSHGRLGRAATMSDLPTTLTRHGSPIRLSEARLKFDFNLASSQPYVGVRAVLPFGN